MQPQQWLLQFSGNQQFGRLKKVSDVTFGLTIKHKHLVENVSNSDYCFRYIVTNDGRSSDLQVWKLGEDSGALNPTLITINQEKARKIKLITPINQVK